MAGNVSDEIEGETFTIDTEAPEEVTAALVHDEDNDTGALINDNITNNIAPTLEGQTEALAQLVVEVAGVSYDGIEADEDGYWSLTLDDLADGQYIPKVQVVDAAGNTSGWLSGTSFTVDTVAPVVPDTLDRQTFAAGQAVNFSAFALIPGYTQKSIDLVEDYGGGLPTGLSIDPSTFHITGTPTESGSTWLAVNFSDAAGNVATSYVQVVATSGILPERSSLTINNTDTATAKTYLGTQGDDEFLNVYRAAGDVLLAQGGNDVIRLPLEDSMGFALIDGGEGIDTLFISQPGFTFDFADVNNPDGTGQVMQNVEILRFTSSATDLTISAKDIFSLSSDLLDADGIHQMVRIDCNPSNAGTVSLDGLNQVGSLNAFDETGAVAASKADALYSKYTGTYTDSLGVNHLVALLVEKGIEAS